MTDCSTVTRLHACWSRYTKNSYETRDWSSKMKQSHEGRGMKSKTGKAICLRAFLMDLGTHKKRKRYNYFFISLIVQYN